MICSNCGFENSEKAKFCNECGAVLVDAYQDSGNQVGANFIQNIPEIGDDGLKGATQSFEDIPLVKDEPEFDFSPIDDDRDQYDDLYISDTHGFDEYLIDSSYQAPQAQWKSGDTMEMPRVEDDPAPRQKEFRAPDPNIKKSNKGKIAALAVVLILVIAALAVGGVTYQMELWGGKSLPDVVGMDKASATETLESQGFVVKALQVKSDDTEDIVLLMDPSAGRRLSEGSEVVLQVATPRTIPDIVGKSEADAQASMAQEGFDKVEYVKQKSNDPEGTVLSVDPVAGTKAKSSTPIKVVVAEPYVVPDTVGKDAATATSTLEQEGYVVAETWVYSEAPEGTVVSSDPAPGTKLTSGSTVTLHIAKSRASELITATENYLYSNMTTIRVDDKEYLSVDSVGPVSYLGNNTTQVTLTVHSVVTTSSGTVLEGPSETKTYTFVWNDDNSLASYS